MRIHGLVTATGISLAIGWSGLLSAEEGVVMFREAPPSAEQLRSLMFPESQPAPPKPRMRGISVVPTYSGPAVPPVPGTGAAGQNPCPECETARKPAAEATQTSAKADVYPAAASTTGAKASPPPAQLQPVAPPAGKGTTVGFNIQFATNSSDLLPSTLPYINSVGEMLQLDSSGKTRVLIAGHADAKGRSDKNQVLSEARAGSVKTYLVQRYGIGADRLETRGYGQNQPLPGTNPNDGVNRRVEFRPLN